MKTVTALPNPEDLTDAEKWRSWTKGEYRLICHTKYEELGDSHKKLREIRKAIPPTPWNDPAATLIKIKAVLNGKT